MPSPDRYTYNLICFGDLIYEFNDSVREKVEKKIKRRLKYHKLGAYDQERVNYIRAIVHELSAEMSPAEKSRFYLHRTSEFSALKDFDLPVMYATYEAKYDKIPADEIPVMVNFAIYSYYLR